MSRSTIHTLNYVPFLHFINSRDIPIFVRSGSVSPIRTNSIRRKYSRSNSQPAPTEDIELNYRRGSSHHSLRRNSGLRKISSQEQVNQLTRFLLLNEEPSMSGSSDSRRGSAGVHFSENVQIRLYRRKSVFNPSPRPDSKPRPRTLSGNGDFDSPSVFTFD